MLEERAELESLTGCFDARDTDLWSASMPEALGFSSRL